MAALSWLNQNKLQGDVLLHKTLELGVEAVVNSSEPSVLLGCIAYPDLHHLIFGNREKIELLDSFVFPTMPMLLAARELAPTVTNTIASHPAPVKFIPQAYKDIRLANSNAAAAKSCASGAVDALHYY